MISAGALVFSTNPARADYAAIVMDAKTGQVLEETNADAMNYPASLTKMMTLYMLFEALESGHVKLTDKVPISTHAASQPPSKLGLQPGQSITVQQAILGLVTRSANDVAAAVGEDLGGSEADFANAMTRRAHALGMTRTTFRNASGLPDDYQVTTARDIATLSRALIHDFPQYYGYFATKSFSFRGRTVATHNKLLGVYEGADGIKTGYIRAQGYNLAASAVRDGRRIIGVVMGGKTATKRNIQMVGLLDQGFGTHSSLAPTMVAESSVNDNSTGDDDGGDTAQPSQTVGYVAPAANGQGTDAGALTQKIAEANQPATQPAVPAAKPITFASITPDTVQVIDGLPATVPAKAKQITIAAKPAKVASAAKKSAKIPPEVPTLKVSADADETASAKSTRSWSIQTGAYPRYSQAQTAARSALKKASSQLAGGRPTVVQASGIYRARVISLTEKQAKTACRTLSQKKVSCLLIAPARDLVEVAQKP